DIDRQRLSEKVTREVENAARPGSSSPRSFEIDLKISRYEKGNAFARAMLPVHAVAISTQSSLACLPAMLAASRRLGVRESTSDFVLPLAVAIFRGTSPAMNLGVAIYAAYLTGTPLSVPALAAGVVVAFLVSLSSVSLPGTLSFIISVGPIAMAMGVPVTPLGLLVAVEMLPDLMRTLGNVTMDVAVTAAVDEGHD
ncbi:MAG TPA: cation:dicarboxylase symporter family transporter, partial [Novosphingobium sp.]|nr:cation:dicarboxylase symporter family transporter [Novosphingobium sp.]